MILDDGNQPVDPSEITISTSEAVISTTFSTIVATAVTKYLLKQDIRSPMGVASAGIIGGGLVGVYLAKKMWQKLAFSAASSGAIAILLLTRKT